MEDRKIYDIAIAGGGLAGLSLGIQAARYGYRVILFEKESYPFHRVCGEYISEESRPFLEMLGLPVSALALPSIRRVQISAPNGEWLEHSLDTGGFGISRYTLDQQLCRIAREAGVEIQEQTKVLDMVFDGSQFLVRTSSGTYPARIAASCHGKRSNLDIQWQRPFVSSPGTRLNNYIGVKYHIQTDWPEDLIALHNFQDGYCGISRIEEGKCCLCYLSRSASLKKYGPSAEQLERNLLQSNPHLRKIFSGAKKLFEQPVAISQISFERKSQVENHVLMIGDAAGMITPLCGNGMSMALHGSKIGYSCIQLFLQGNISREEMERDYVRHWNREFGKRLLAGRAIQRLFGKTWATNLFIRVMKRLPGLTGWLISQTHGKTF